MDLKDKIFNEIKYNPGINILKLTQNCKTWIGDILENLDVMSKENKIKILGKSIFLSDYKSSLNKNKQIKREKKVSIEDLKILLKYKKIIEQNYVKPATIYEQFHCTPFTNLKRYRLANQRKLNGKSLLFFGDDDLTSILFSYINKNLNIHVIEIDKRICKLIDKISYKHNLNIETINQDYRKKIIFNRKIDIFFTDPPANINSISTISNHINRFSNKSAILYLSFPLFMADSSKNRFFYELRKIGLDLIQEYTDFNEYDNRCFIESYCTKRQLQLLNKFGFSKNDVINSKPFMKYGMFVLKINNQLNSKIYSKIYTEKIFN